jgi:hypothetical protein
MPRRKGLGRERVDSRETHGSPAHGEGRGEIAPEEIIPSPMRRNGD